MTVCRVPYALININGNVPEWRRCFGPPGEIPRLPLPFAFGAALAAQGFSLVAYDTSEKPPPSDIAPFACYYSANAFRDARDAAHLVVLSGTRGVRSCIAEVNLPRTRRKMVLFSYVWRPVAPVSVARRAMLSLTRQAARLARGVILMTEQQVASAKADLGHKVPIVRLRVGVDTQFYGRQSTDTDVPDEHRKIVESLVRTKYLILPGDELRLNDDALDVVEMTGIRLVRISQYRYKSGTNRLQQEIERRGLRDRLVLFERISYSFLRFLLQHATAYAGFVDASWQPAGWTVACESLASGLPLVMYDGLTARELIDLGIPRNLLQVIEPGDRTTFAEQLDKTMRHSGTQKIKLARAFADETLNLEQTGPEFAHDFMVNFGRVV